MIREAAVNKRMQVGPLTVGHVSGFRVPILIFAPTGWGVGKVGPTAPRSHSGGESDRCYEVFYGLFQLLWGPTGSEEMKVIVSVGAHQDRPPPFPRFLSRLLSNHSENKDCLLTAKEKINEKWISFYFFIFFLISFEHSYFKIPGNLFCE